MHLEVQVVLRTIQANRRQWERGRAAGGCPQSGPGNRDTDAQSPRQSSNSGMHEKKSSAPPPVDAAAASVQCA
jgi:hypothetical protein